MKPNRYKFMIDNCFKRRLQAKAGYTQRNIAVSTSYFFFTKNSSQELNSCNLRKSAINRLSMSDDMS